jgi:hypothetical protein
MLLRGRINSTVLKTTRRDVAKTSSTLQRAARERADNEAGRVRWEKLLEARNQYIDWQEFYLWLRSILEVEHCVPAWLREVLDDRCPRFLEEKERCAENPTSKRPLHLSLEDWIEDQVFGATKREGWFNAIAYYAIRDTRYQKAEVCWSECVKKWKRVKPIRYPSFDEWRSIAAKCDSTVHLSAGERKSRASSPHVDPNRLADAVSRYIDWEAFAYWTRPALESPRQLPGEVAAELGRRCPGFVEALAGEAKRSFRSRAHSWDRLMTWIADHFLQDAQNEGWFDAILTQARNHPRAIRTMEYADDCDEAGHLQTPEAYPSFQEWRKQADSYLPSAD